MLKRTIGRFRPAIVPLLWANAAMVLVVITNGVSLFSLQPIIDQIFVAPQDPVTWTVPWLGWPITETKRHLLIGLTAFFIVSRVLYSTGLYAQRYLMMSAGEVMVNRLRADLYDHLLALSASFYGRRRTGEMVANVTSDLGLVQHLASTITADLIRRPFEIFFLIGLLFWLDAHLAAGSLLVAPFVIGIVKGLGTAVRRRSARMQSGMGEIAANLTETIGGIRIVQAFGAERSLAGRFDRLLQDYLGKSRRAYLVIAASTPATEMVTAIAIAAILLYGGGEVVAGRLTPGQFFTFMAILMATYQPVKTLVNALAEAQRAAAALDRIYALLDEPPAIQAGRGKAATFAREIVFENVSFDYATSARATMPGRRPEPSGKAGAPEAPATTAASGASGEPLAEAAAVREIDLAIRRGETVAFVGPSGAGKSTLLSLVPRFHDPTSGRVRLDDHDLRDLDPAGVRRLIGIVTQETFLFHDTLRENIRLGRPDATDAEVWAAAEAAQIAAFIRGLPEGLETMAGERGTRLSGGEKQRLAIARALLIDPPILILDEATSSLDSESERAVQNAIERLVKGRTVLVIAHRLSTVQSADRIVVLEKGRIVEVGTHAELLARSGLYANLHALQFQA